MNLQLSGKRALVTAGAAGIGRAIARAMREAGAKVFICDIDPAALDAARAEMPDAGFVGCDVADRAQVAAMMEAGLRFLGGLDILVNNAGIAGPTALIQDVAPADWDRTVAVNLTSMYDCTRLAVPHLKAAGEGSIINLSSVAGRLGFPLRTPYAATKWAVVGLTKSLALELGPHGIRVNCLQPGMVEGERIDRVIDAKARARGVPFEQQRDELVSVVALRRMVSAEDIAAMAIFLASPAGRNISGQALSICGNHETLA